MSERLIIVGDIHGCYHTLLDLLRKLDYVSRTDTLVFVGDYIDRGPWAFDVVRTLRELQRQVGRDRVICLRGNHEQFAIDYAGRLTPRWERNGGAATLRSYDLNGADMEDDIAWFRSLPLVYDAGEILICHAGLRYPQLCDNTEEDLLWGREWIAYDRQPREKQVVFGHTPLRTFLPYAAGTGDICIDCGCVYGGSLCALVIQEDGSRAFVSVRKSEKDSETELENREKE